MEKKNAVEIGKFVPSHNFLHCIFSCYQFTYFLVKWIPKCFGWGWGGGGGVRDASTYKNQCPVLHSVNNTSVNHTVWSPTLIICNWHQIKKPFVTLADEKTGQDYTRDWQWPSVTPISSGHLYTHVYHTHKVNSPHCPLIGHCSSWSGIVFLVSSIRLSVLCI